MTARSTSSNSVMAVGAAGAISKVRNSGSFRIPFPPATRRLTSGADAEIIGQVTPAALRFTDFDKSRETLEKLADRL